MTQEQIFQIKLASVDLAIKSGANNVVNTAQSIYDYVVAEAVAKEATAKVSVINRKPSIQAIQESLNAE